MGELLTVVAEMTAKPGKEEELRKAALALVEPTRREDGCVQYDLHCLEGEPGRLLFYENWMSAAHLERHLESPHLTAFGAIAGDLLAAPPRVDKFRRIA